MLTNVSSLKFSKQQQQISRKLNYKLSIISLSLLAFTTQPISAQIPTFDEYNTGSGTYIRPKISSASTQRETISVSQQSFDKDLLKNKLSKIKTLITKGLWDDILLEIKTISFVSKKNYGLDKVLNESIENEREELKFVIGQVPNLIIIIITDIFI